jgi:hypothetical protein
MNNGIRIVGKGMYQYPTSNMIDLQTMRRVYKGKDYTDQQLLQIRDFLYRVAEMGTQIDTQHE